MNPPTFSETLPHYVSPPLPGTQKQFPVTYIAEPGDHTVTSVEMFVAVAVIHGDDWTTVVWRAV